jgi:hypothetical protein
MKPSASIIIWFREGQYSAIILEKKKLSLASQEPVSNLMGKE